MKAPETTIERAAYDSEVARLAAQVYHSTPAMMSRDDRAREAVAIARAIISFARK